MKNANQDLNRLQQPNVLPISVGWTCYLGNLGSRPPGASMTIAHNGGMYPNDVCVRRRA